ncbi:MAG: aminotransferase class I/II-fold pyridoxal phosphate-dependent enzyme [Treponema sp.]|nr:aminotransferase class I/II-fold pyridoxal phosphate-dependent enzyme [Treponema sp.]
MYLTHGGDIYTALLSLKKAPLDFSSNINPLGIPPAVVSALKENAHTFAAYPDPLCRRLRSALSSIHGIDAGQIVCGNGAADLIHRLAIACKPREALVTAPSFSDYEKALEEAGCGVRRFFARPPGFLIDKSLVSHITNSTDMFFLCNPNNPTGGLVPPDLLRIIIERCTETNTILVLDECFNAFLDDPEANSALRYIPPARNRNHRSPKAGTRIVILNALTKTYALAGLRFGYILCSSLETARLVAETGQTWPVSLAAECAAFAALKASTYLEESRRLVRAGRAWLKQELSRLGFEVMGGEANYVFFKTSEDAVFNRRTFFQDLLERGILLRSCANYHGLDDSYFRAAVKNPEENAALIAAIEDLGNSAGGKHDES